MFGDKSLAIKKPRPKTNWFSDDKKPEVKPFWTFLWDYYIYIEPTVNFLNGYLFLISTVLIYSTVLVKFVQDFRKSEGVFKPVPPIDELERKCEIVGKLMKRMMEFQKKTIAQIENGKKQILSAVDNTN